MTSTHAPVSPVHAAAALPPIGGLSGAVASDRRLTLRWVPDPAYVEYEIHESVVDPTKTWKATVPAPPRVSGRLEVRPTPLRYGVRGLTAAGEPGPFGDAVEVLVRTSSGTVTVTGEPFTPVARDPLVGAELPQGAKPRDLIKFNSGGQGWKLNLDVDDHGDHGPGKTSVEKSASTLAGGFSFDGHFEVADGGTAVRFLAHLGGAVTSGSHNPRTELREMTASSPGTKAAWKIAADDHTRHVLTAQVKVTRAPATPGHQKVTIGQIHTADNDLLEIMYDRGKKAVGYTWDGDGDGTAEWQPELLVTGYEPGDGWFTYRVEVESGTVTISVDTGGGFEKKATQEHASAEGCYYKAGVYPQSHPGQGDVDPDDFGEALFRSITVKTG